MSQIEIVLFLNFQSGCLLFLFLASLLWLESPIQCWIEVPGEDIFVLLLILGGKHTTFTIKYDVSYGIFIDALYQVEEVPFYSWLIEFFFLIMKEFCIITWVFTKWPSSLMDDLIRDISLCMDDIEKGTPILQVDVLEKPPPLWVAQYYVSVFDLVSQLLLSHPGTLIQDLICT